MIFWTQSHGHGQCLIEAPDKMFNLVCMGHRFNPESTNIALKMIVRTGIFTATPDLV